MPSKSPLAAGPRLPAEAELIRRQFHDKSDCSTSVATRDHQEQEGDLIDLDGKIQRPEYVGGQVELLVLAKENIAKWKVEPAKINGAPIATGVVAQVQFK